MPYACPLPASLTAIPDTDCPFQLDQVVAAAVFRGNAALSMTTTTVLLEATWNTALAAENDDTVVLTPRFGAWTLPTTEPNIEGQNDNLMPGGIGVPQISGPIVATFSFHNKSPLSITALRKLSGEPDLKVILINQFGQIAFKSTSTDVTGIPIYNPFFGSRTSGYNVTDKNASQFTLPYNWDDNLKMFTPSFDILAKLPK